MLLLYDNSPGNSAPANYTSYLLVTQTKFWRIEPQTDQLEDDLACGGDVVGRLRRSQFKLKDQMSTENAQLTLRMFWLR